MIEIKFFTQQRAIEIRDQCKAQANYGPWSDQLSKVMSSGERRQVMDIWNHESISGGSSFYSVFMEIVNGRIDPARFPEAPEPIPSPERPSWGEIMALV